MKQPHRIASLLPVLGVILFATGCERPPPDTLQQGFRGTGMVAVTNPRLAAARAAIDVVPAAQPPLVPVEGTPLAKDVYQNVQVLTDLDVAEFTRLMLAMTQWVSPEQGCGYCHNEANHAEDAKYTKIVARRMLQMTRHVNMQWGSHVKETGVTCYTCHRGQPVPANIWFADPGPRTARGMAGNRARQNSPAESVRLASLPYDPFTPFLLQDQPIRVKSTNALPNGSNPANIKAAEWTYALMMHMSDGLGVNCTHCHNTQHFASWDGAPPARVTAWHGIRMVRALNNDYVEPLQDRFPANRLGPMGDVAKVNCATCHHNAAKPLNGQSMLGDYPELARIKPPPPPPVEQVPADAPLAEAVAGPAAGAM
jgi:photosynthetic reaction center cytochrome c subunit